MKSKLSILLASVILLAAACNKPTLSLPTPAPAQQPNPANTQSSNPAAAGGYKNYSPETVIAEQKAGRKVVLFFHAPWCPFCRAADQVFQSDATAIPDGVTLLKTDYDSNAELKTKYGVTYQHTFVQIDDQGNLVTKWVSGDAAALAQNIK